MARRTRKASKASAADHAGFTVAIVGRPNVGKSTLFNRLTGRRLALVHDRPGVTRDRREGRGELAGLAFRVIDTAGFEDASAETLEGRMRAQTERAVEDADVALLVIDAAAGVTPMDEHFAALLRKKRTPIVLVANKCDVKGAAANLPDAYRLGLGAPVELAAEHGDGLAALFQAIAPFAPEEGEKSGVEDAGETPEDTGDGTDDEDDPDKPLMLAIVGRPNTGKSTLVNRLLGEERLLTGPEPGVTRDAIAVKWQWKGRPVRLVDTAGVRRKAKVTDAVERLSVAETFNTIKMAEVVVLVLDAGLGMDKQELTIARHVLDEGRALVIAVNKWDAVKDKNAALARVTGRVEDSLAQVRGVPIVTISARTGQRVDALMDAVAHVHGVWNTRVPTAQLNRWLSGMTQAHPPPLSAHKQRVKLRYMTQTKARPPTFVIFSTRPMDLPDAYARYLTNGLRDTFGLDGIPIRIYVKKQDNPYVD